MGEADYQQYNLGMEALENERYLDALEHFRRSNSEDLHFKTTHRIAQLLSKLGRQQDADEHFKRAYELNQSNSQVAVDFARVLIRNDDRAAALRIVNAVLKQNPTYGPAREIKADVVADDGDDK